MIFLFCCNAVTDYILEKKNAFCSCSSHFQLSVSAQKKILTSKLHQSKKRMKVVYTLILNALMLTRSNAVCEIEANPAACASMFPNGVVPQSPSQDSTMICRRTSSRGYFMTSFGNDIKSPDFSAYKVTRDEALTLTSDRPWSWRKDPDVDENSQVKHYARSSGATSGSPCWGTNGGSRDFSWDRGHLAPNKIMSAHPAECEGQWQTFYITNAAMQYDDMNRGSWESLESHVYEWLEEKSASVNANEIYVVSGAVYAGRQNSGDLRCDLDTGLNFDRTSSSTTNLEPPHMAIIVDNLRLIPPDSMCPK